MQWGGEKGGLGLCQVRQFVEGEEGDSGREAMYHLVLELSRQKLSAA